MNMLYVVNLPCIKIVMAGYGCMLGYMLKHFLGKESN